MSTGSKLMIRRAPVAPAEGKPKSQGFPPSQEKRCRWNPLQNLSSSASISYPATKGEGKSIREQNLQLRFMELLPFISVIYCWEYFSGKYVNISYS